MYCTFTLTWPCINYVLCNCIIQYISCKINTYTQYTLFILYLNFFGHIGLSLLTVNSGHSYQNSLGPTISGNYWNFVHSILFLFVGRFWIIYKSVYVHNSKTLKLKVLVNVLYISIFAFLYQINDLSYKGTYSLFPPFLSFCVHKHIRSQF